MQDLLLEFAKWSQGTAVGTAVRESLWLFPVIETIHLFGIVLLVGGTSIIDLRLIGLAFKEDPVSKLIKRYITWAWAGFAIQVVTGIAMFASEAVKMIDDPAFRLKMVFIVMAGLNALAFELLAHRRIDEWDNNPSGPFSARVAGVISILLWFGIVAAGRWIAYV